MAQRVLCSRARVNLRKQRLSDADLDALKRTANEISSAPLLVDDTSDLTILELRARARIAHRKHHLRAVFVDYLQLMRGGRRIDSREQEISEISRSLKALAKELNLPVVALSQLNRRVEERHNKRPQLADLRESGAIEQDADVIVFIYRDEVYHPDSPDKGVAELIIGKQRSGPTGSAKLTFLTKYTRFDNLAFEETA